ncbi:hypothetical protein [Lysinibacillus contaminans]|uniref:hypothetical protein n=1 Tax=Lysinibacillus contaminans TaxID=1293441 RepID=UPI0006AFB14E|nr:hypothetical protein [Lysinibacillus contaminans]
MKKKLTISTLVLGLSVVAGSAYAASNTDMWEPTKSSAAVSIEEAAKEDNSKDFAQIAKEKGITLEELFAQLEKEGKMTKAVQSTEAIKSSEPVNLEEMAKEKGITLDELIAQLEKEGKLTKAAKLTEAKQVETSNK